MKKNTDNIKLTVQKTQIIQRTKLAFGVFIYGNISQDGETQRKSLFTKCIHKLFYKTAVLVAIVIGNVFMTQCSTCVLLKTYYCDTPFVI